MYKIGICHFTRFLMLLAWYLLVARIQHSQDVLVSINW